MDRKLNLASAGYHMLQILAAVDGTFSVEEDMVIRRYLFETFPFTTNLDNEMDYLSKLNSEDYYSHFLKCMDDFYADSTEKERAHFIDFAMKLVKADRSITKDENLYIDTLFNAWEPDHV
jgi:hypothetical protein